jgi:hypothetical protein
MIALEETTKLPVGAGDSGSSGAVVPISQGCSSVGSGLDTGGRAFPFDFCFDEQVLISDALSPGSAMRLRKNDLIIDADAAAFQRLDRGLRIYREALTPDKVAKEARRAPEARAGVPPGRASYSFADSFETVLNDDSANGNHGKARRRAATDQGGGQGCATRFRLDERVGRRSSFNASLSRGGSSRGFRSTQRHHHFRADAEVDRHSSRDFIAGEPCRALRWRGPHRRGAGSAVGSVQSSSTDDGARC